MKLFKMTLLASMISTPTLADETIDKTWEIGVFGDYIKSSTHKETDLQWQQMEAGKSLGIDLQKEINEYWSMRLELARTRYDINDGTDKKYGDRYGIDALYHLDDSDFYLFTGVKRFHNAESYNAVNIGTGYNYQLTERATLYSEAVVYRDVDYGYTDQGFKLGFKYAFGEVKKTPTVTREVTPVIEPTPVQTQVNNDTDNDGVINKYDRCTNTPADVKVDSRGCTLFSEETVSIKLNVNFATNSDALDPTEMVDIQRLADFMKEYEDTNVMIEGHSSATGSADYNLALSQKRADAVKSALINEFSIDERRLSTKGFGEEQLLAKGNTPEDHLMNRRVIAKIEKTIEKAVTTK